MKPQKKESMLFWFSFIILCSACSAPPLPEQNHLVTVVAAPVQSLNPLYATDASSQHINELLHAGLVTIGENLMPEPYLAESILVLGPKKIEFRLRQGCLFSSGREITAEDVKRSVELFQNPQNGSAFLESFKEIKEIQIKEKYRFHLITNKPSPAMLSDLELLKIVDLQSADSLNSTHLPGAGPFDLETLSSSQIVMRKKNQPCLPSPSLDKITVKVVRDDLSRFFKLKKGEIDLVLNEMNFRKIETIRSDRSLPMEVLSKDGISYTYLGLNLSSEKLKDPKVRRALALSLDIPTLIKFKSRGFAKQARNILAEDNFYNNPNVPIIKRDLEKARELLGEAGFFNGINGKPRLKLSFKTNTNPISVENARVLVAQAKEAGIELEHRAFEWGVFYNDVKTGNTEVYMLRWVGVSDPRIYYENFHSSFIGSSNRTRFVNKKLDHLLEQGETLLDLEKRKKIYWEIQDLVAGELPYIGLWHTDNVAVFRKEVRNLTLHPAGKWLPLLKIKKEIRN